MITWMADENNFQVAKLQPQGVAWHLLNFCQFQPGVAYESVVYIKKACIANNSMYRSYFVVTSLVPCCNFFFLACYQIPKTSRKYKLKLR